MKTDAQVQRDVLDELHWHPSVDATQIGVAAHKGVVTLTGTTISFAEKFEAERLAKTIDGVRAIANDIDVRLPGEHRRNDTELATAALNSLKWHTSIPEGKVQVTVRDGWITLEGKLEWQYQRQAARDAVRYLVGVKGVTSNITIAEKPKAADIKKAIESAFKRNAELDASLVRVSTTGNAVTLEGKVSNLIEYDDAEAVAWAAPGVSIVDNELVVAAGK